MLSYGTLDSPIGKIYVALDGEQVISLSFTSESEDCFCREVSAMTSQPLKRSLSSTSPVIKELKEYFSGERREFSFSPKLSGHSAFQSRVLDAASSIPYGETQTYGWLATRAGSPRAARAAGQVMARNPVPIIIPCHRVIGSNGKLCGFAGGLKALELKKKLLAAEGVQI